MSRRARSKTSIPIAKGISSMRLIQADCTVEYEGRGHTTIPRGIRLVIVKSDNSVAIHTDTGFKPINYMAKKTTIDEYIDDSGANHIRFSSKTESIDVTVFGILFDMELDFPEDTSLNHKGTEKQLQAWLTMPSHFHDMFGENIDFVTREWQTTKGAVDILGIDRSDGQLVLIEVKRSAKKNDCYQLVRYSTALMELHGMAVEDGEDVIQTTMTKSAVPVATASTASPHMVLVAPNFKKGTAEEAERRGIRIVKVPRDWFKVMQDEYELYGAAGMVEMGVSETEMVGLERDGINETDAIGKGAWLNKD